MATGVVTSFPADEVLRCVWASLAGNETGDSVQMYQYPDRTVQASGTFTSITIQGSNDGVTWFTLNDPLGVDLAFIAPGMALIAENPILIRPVAVGGGAGCTVSIIGVGE